MCKYRILLCGECGGAWQQELVRRHTNTLETVTVAHDYVSVGDTHGVKYLRIQSEVVIVSFGAHHRAGRNVTNHDSTLFQLHDAGEQFRRRTGLTVDQQDQFASETMAAAGLRHNRLRLLSRLSF